ncbi:SDR family NAD(P)-dependent oxidoreductase [Microvirga sp. TS319]|uniref:SDR family NAD(P)-dependent oxidoreductase n=1 Tax=Microvirga sp. TS319 TaxID=3241165 RepID=UPI00351A3EC8
MSASSSLSSKVALVVGGSRGIGAAAARKLASMGAQVAVTYKTRRDAADEVVSDITEAGGKAAAFEADIVQAPAIDSLLQAVSARFGGIDILVNSAGIAPYRPLGSMDAAFVREIMDANVVGTVLLTQAAVPLMTSPGGRIVHFSSRLATSPIPTSSVYAASKAAVSALVHAFSKELGPKGITINAVAPGVIETDMTAAIIQERGRAIRSTTPLGRIGQPDDIAGIVAFLASPDSDWITGRTILADGGLS